MSQASAAFSASPAIFRVAESHPCLALQTLNFLVVRIRLVGQDGLSFGLRISKQSTSNCPKENMNANGLPPETSQQRQQQQQQLPLQTKPRRPHHKSRTGCQNCKVRKVKCDETKPICKKCEAHGASCSYLQTHPLKRGPPTIQSMLSSPNTTSHSSGSHPHTPISESFSPAPSAVPPAPAPPVSPMPVSLPANFTILDMELLHFWTTQSVEGFIDFQDCVELFRTTVVQIAFEFPFLMHELLSLSALHLARLRPERSKEYIQVSDTHAATALALFQPQIAALTPENCHACFAFSTTLFVHAWASQSTTKPSALFFRPKLYAQDSTFAEIDNVQWVKLHRGSQTILQSIYPVLSKGPLEMIFTPWRSLDPARPDPLLGSEARLFDDLTEAWKTSAQLTADHKAALDNALFKLKRVFSMLTYNLNISKLSIVMAWFPMIPEEYLKMMEQKIPEALLLVLYYCVALKRLEHLWWVKGKAENLLNTVNVELGTGWERWTRWPIEQVLGPSTGGGVMGFGQIMNSV